MKYFRFQTFPRAPLFLRLFLLLLPFGCGERQPVSLLPSAPPVNATLVAFELSGVAKSDARFTIAPVAGQKFTHAIRATTREKPQHPYEIQLTAYTIMPLRQGDAVLATFYIRGLEARSETGEAFTTFTFERNGEPYTRSALHDTSAGPDWRRVDVPFTVREDYAPGKAMMNLRLGFAPQTIEIGGIQLLNYGSKVKLSELPVAEPLYRPGNPDAAWRATALQRIEKIRKANVTVRVTDAAGQPLQNAQVALHMRRHAFTFGTAVDAKTLLGTSRESERYRGIVEKYFNRVTFENDMKWWAWNDVERRRDTLAALDWLRARDIAVRGHNLVWPSFEKTVDTAKLKDDPAALRRHLINHIREEAGSLRGKVVAWDVVNEPYTNDDLLKILGRAAMVDWYRETRDVDERAQLCINDFGILSGGGNDHRHQNAYADTIQFLLDNDAPLGGIGMQGHIGGQNLTPPPRLLEVLDRFGRFKLPIEITEFDVNTKDEATQAAYLRDFLTATFSHSAVEGVTMWGFWEGLHWAPDAALWRRDWSLKPVGEAWLDLVFKTWWTDVAGVTDARGEYSTRGFLGDYVVDVTHGGRTQSVPLQLRGDKARRDGVVLEVRLD